VGTQGAAGARQKGINAAFGRSLQSGLDQGALQPLHDQMGVVCLLKSCFMCEVLHIKTAGNGRRYTVHLIQLDSFVLWKYPRPNRIRDEHVKCFQ
jgi:hypothetical protein